MLLRILLVLALQFISPVMLHAQDDPYPMEEYEVWLLQHQLYELNYDIGVIDGKFGKKTRSAVADWQRQRELTVTGVPTKEQFDYLTGLDLPSGQWAAISSATSGAFSAVWSRSSRAEAENDAESGCEARASGECVTITDVSFNSADYAWIAAVRCKNYNYEYTAVVNGTSRSEAENKAFKRASNKGYARSDCELREVIEARGRHK